MCACVSLPVCLCCLMRTSSGFLAVDCFLNCVYSHFVKPLGDKALIKELLIHPLKPQNSPSTNTLNPSKTSLGH